MAAAVAFRAFLKKVTIGMRLSHSLDTTCGFAHKPTASAQIACKSGFPSSLYFQGVGKLDFKRRESLRCLFASVASLTVMDWLLKSEHLRRVISEADDVDEMLVNIRSFFMVGWGLSQQEVRDRFVPIGSVLFHHLSGVLFADAVRWWAAAHRTGSDENKYLRDAMYKGEFADLRSHFYHGFRNNQLAHFPGGPKSNDNPLLTPAPYGFFLSQKEYQDFRSLLAHSIKLSMLGQDQFESHRDIIGRLLDDNDEMSQELKEAAVKTFSEILNELDDEILRIPTRNYFPDANTG